jgi:hypothetical protein
MRLYNAKPPAVVRWVLIASGGVLLIRLSIAICDVFAIDNDSFGYLYPID